MAATTGYTLMHRDEFECAGKWALARRSLGLRSFGMNVVDLQPGERIPEHDEAWRNPWLPRTSYEGGRGVRSCHGGRSGRPLRAGSSLRP
jgi:hypothetical protein